MKSKCDLTENTVYNFRRWFISYINSFSSSDTTMHHSFTLKKEHSLRVCKEILNLGNMLGLDIEGLLLAETAALFHDIGRFEQYPADIGLLLTAIQKITPILASWFLERKVS